jgi:hypothetical protein
MFRWLTGLFCLLVGTSAFSQINEVGFDIASDSSLNIQSGIGATSGQSLVVNIVGNNWTTATVGGGVDLTFDNSLLSLQSVVIDTANFDIPYGTCDNTGGFSGCATPGASTSGSVSQIDFGQLLDSAASGNFEIATLTFAVIGQGTDATGLGLTQDSGNPFVDTSSNTLPATFESASVTVSSSVVPPVPEPPTAMLVGIALLGFGLYRRFATSRGLLP